MEAPATDVVHRRSVALQFDGPEQSPLYFEGEVVPAEEVEAAIDRMRKQSVALQANTPDDYKELHAGMEAPAADVVHRRSVALQFDGDDEPFSLYQEEVVPEEVNAVADRMRKQSVALQANTSDDYKELHAGMEAPAADVVHRRSVALQFDGDDEPFSLYQEEVVPEEVNAVADRMRKQSVALQANTPDDYKELHAGMEAPAADVVHRRSVALQFDGDDEPFSLYQEEMVPEEVNAVADRMRKQSVALQANTSDDYKELHAGTEAPAADVVHRRSVALQFDGDDEPFSLYQEEVVPEEVNAVADRMRKQSVALQANTPDDYKELHAGMEAPAADVVHRRSVALQFDGDDEPFSLYQEEVVPEEVNAVADRMRKQSVALQANTSDDYKELHAGMEAPAADVVHRRSVALQFDGDDEPFSLYQEEVVPEEVNAVADRMRKQSVALQANTPDDYKELHAGMEAPAADVVHRRSVALQFDGDDEPFSLYQEEMVPEEVNAVADRMRKQSVALQANTPDDYKELHAGMEAPAADVVHRRSVALQFDGDDEPFTLYQEEVVPEEVNAVADRMRKQSVALQANTPDDYKELHAGMEAPAADVVHRRSVALQFDGDDEPFSLYQEEVVPEEVNAVADRMRKQSVALQANTSGRLQGTSRWHGSPRSRCCPPTLRCAAVRRRRRTLQSVPGGGGTGRSECCGGPHAEAVGCPAGEHLGRLQGTSRWHGSPRSRCCPPTLRCAAVRRRRRTLQSVPGGGGTGRGECRD
ncbi:hypothetical protein, conserved [Angomonas deanei]|uniref:Uncharacterized protein n=1 Tax=Angomonas deanei TaxID=59799 RepID=A0A7G2CAL9_9TRYP|nr:hypothetical protein, conserved [Angomonas deanei]